MRFRLSTILLALLLLTSTGVCAESLSYRAHVSDIGWMDYVGSGQIAGTTGEHKKLEALDIKLNLPTDNTLIARAHIQDTGWVDVTPGEIIGTTGKNLRLEAFALALQGEAANYYDIYYRSHVSDIGWLDWAKNGEESGSQSLARQIEAVEIRIVSLGDTPPGSTLRPFAYKDMEPVAPARVHIENVGWEDTQLLNTVIGTTGKNQQIEAVEFNLKSINSGDIVYSTHVSNIGWQEPVKNGEMAGTTGENKKVEAITINLTGGLAAIYDIYYQSHIENYGWLEWAKNGQISGTTGANLKLEALNVTVVPKGSPAPGPVEEAYITPLKLSDFSNRVRGCWRDPKTGQVFAISDTYLSTDNYEGYFTTKRPSKVGGRIRLINQSNQEVLEPYLSFLNISANQLNYTLNGNTVLLEKGQTTDNIHYTFPNVFEGGQLKVYTLKFKP